MDVQQAFNYAFFWACGGWVISSILLMWNIALRAAAEERKENERLRRQAERYPLAEKGE